LCPEANAMTLSADLNRTEPKESLRQHGKDAAHRARLGRAAGSYRIPEVAPTLDEARAYCRRLAESHYENFHVASWFLPKALRPHFHAIYAYCRISDDLGDEVGDPEQALALLDCGARARRLLRGPRAPSGLCGAGGDDPRLRHSQGALCRPADGLSPGPDRHALRLMDDLLAYCRYSANPVGRLVLYACGEADEERSASPIHLHRAAAGQLLAGCAPDYAKGRIYLPQEDMQRFGVGEETIAEGMATPEFRELLRHEVDYARGLFEEGPAADRPVNRDLALDLDLFSRGGLEISARHRAAGLRRAERPAGALPGHQAQARAAGRGGQGAALSRLARRKAR
jgi:phytoene/squalene synthetase